MCCQTTEKRNAMFYIAYFNDQTELPDQYRFRFFLDAMDFAIRNGFKTIRNDNGEVYHL